MRCSSRAHEPTARAACLTVFDSNVPRFFREEERPEFEAFLDALPGPYLVEIVEVEREGFGPGLGERA